MTGGLPVLVETKGVTGAGHFNRENESCGQGVADLWWSMKGGTLEGDRTGRRTRGERSVPQTFAE